MHAAGHKVSVLQCTYILSASVDDFSFFRTYFALVKFHYQAAYAGADLDFASMTNVKTI